MPIDCRSLIFQPVWIYEGGAKTSTLNFRAVGVFGSPQDNEDIFAFSDLLCVCSLENASWIFSCFLISTNVKDVFDY